MEKPKNLYAQPMDIHWSGLLERMGVLGRGGQRGKNWDNCNSIINIIYIVFKVEKGKNTINSTF